MSTSLRSLAQVVLSSASVFPRMAVSRSASAHLYRSFTCVRFQARPGLTVASRNTPTRILGRTMANNTRQQQGADEETADWKKRAPYKIHDSDKDFKVVYEANCHCERVKYQLSREKPLASKLCHCTTCQSQHGTLSLVLVREFRSYSFLRSRTVPMGGHLRERRYQLHSRPPQSRVVRPYEQEQGAQAALQSEVQLLPESHHGRGAKHDSAVSEFDQTGCRGEREVQARVSSFF